MRENGSPEPTFEFDDARTYYRTVLPIHPDYLFLELIGRLHAAISSRNLTEALSLLEEARIRIPSIPKGGDQYTRTFIEAMIGLFEALRDDSSRENPDRIERFNSAIDHLKTSLARSNLDSGSP